MTDHAGTPTDIDWDEAIRRERRRDAGSVLAGALGVAGLALLRWVQLPVDRALWMTCGIGAGVGLIGILAVVGVRSMSDSYRVQYAVRDHLDPGPELRVKADRFALKRSIHYARWGLPLYGLTEVLRGRWEQPVLAVTGTVLLVAAIVAAIVWEGRLAFAAERWLEDPPGPPREPQPQKSGQRELTRFFVVAGTVVVGLFLLALVTS